MAKPQSIPRPGGRSARVRQQVEDAVRWLLERKPRSEISIAEIAERSGVHAASIYRRWGTIEALLLDMTVERLSQESPLAETGSLEDDLLAWATRIARSVFGPDGPVFLLTVVQTPLEDREALVRRGGEIQTLLDRAAARGEPKLSYVDAIDGLVSPLYGRALFGMEKPDAAELLKMVRRTIRFAADSTPGPRRIRKR